MRIVPITIARSLGSEAVPDILRAEGVGADMATLFEKIIAGDLPAKIVFKDARVTAFLDIRPAAPIHILIVTNKVIATVNDIADGDEALLGHMFIVARDLAKSNGIDEDGYRLIVNCNAHGGQEVYHLHMHLLGGRPLGPMVLRN